MDCRLIAQPITLLDAVMPLLFHTGRQRRGASEFFRWALVTSQALPCLMRNEEQFQSGGGVYPA